MSDKKKVLALDDQRSMQNILKFALKSEFDVTVVGRADEALQKAKEETFDFILLDITLDDDRTDGIGVAKELEEAGSGVPVAFLSSMTEETLDDGQKARVKTVRNIRFYQTKPIAPPDLIARIKGIIG